MIPLFHPPDQDVEATLKELRDTLESRWWGQGPKVDRWEEAFGKEFGFKYCVATNSCTAALHLAFVLAGLKPGRRAMVPVLTCSATSHAVRYTGAEISYVDIKPDTLTLDSDDLAHRCQAGDVIVPVHLSGLVDSAKAIKAWADVSRCTIVEDAAQALGADGVGYGHFTCFSFQAIKALSTGDGGMLVCQNEEDYKRAKRLRWFAIDREQKQRRDWQAWDRRGITFDQEEMGWKYQPTDIDACFGLAALPTFRTRELAHRHALARAYREHLKGCPGVDLLKGEGSADWLFMVLVRGDRDALAGYLLKHDIETNVAHIRNDVFQVFGGHRHDLPGMASVEYRYLCLPMNSKVSLENVEFICQKIWDWSGNPV